MTQMERRYFILSEENNWFPLGCIFERLKNEKLLCLDNNKICENINKVINNCIDIDKKSAILLREVSLGNRIQLLNSENWDAIAKLDVGDDCFYTSSGHEIPCKIISKQLGNKGVIFTVIIENGKKCNLSIDRLRLDKINSVFISKHDSVTTKSLINYDITKPNISTSIDLNRENNKDPTANCKCLINILQKANCLELTQKEKEKLFQSLFTILPVLPNDDEGKCGLHWACHYLLTDSVTTLLNINDEKNKQDKEGNVPLYFAINSPLSKSKDAEQNLEKVVITLITRGADINIKNNQNETPLVKIIKNGNFSLLEKVLKNYPDQFLLSDHLLSGNASLLELLIKLQKNPLASLYCTKLKMDIYEDNFFIPSAYLAVTKGANDLCIEILLKTTDINQIILQGETFLTKIVNDTNINSETICFLLNSFNFKLDKANFKDEYPLNLSCRRLLIDVVKVMLNKSFFEVLRLNEAFEETITAYTEFYISATYKSSRQTEIQSIIQGKQIAIEILNVLLKNGVNIEFLKPSIIYTIENCMDIDFVKIVKHLCRLPALQKRDSIDGGLIQNVNQCQICMDRLIDCAFTCGHTCCFQCGSAILKCHACRENVKERRKIFIS